MPDQHADLAPSKIYQWGPCTPSPMLEKTVPNIQSDAAAEGTVAHSVAEICLRYAAGLIMKTDYDEELEKLKQSEWYTEDMLEDCTNYANYICKYLDDTRRICPAAFLEVEQRVNLNRWIPGSFGTTDAVIVAEPTLYVFDFKYGKGHRVSAEDNPQMKAYALGTYDAYELLYEIDSIMMTIIQPRLSNGISYDEIPVDELLHWGDDWLKPRALLAAAGEGEFAPSPEVCKFCRVRDRCKARAEKLLELFDENQEFDPRLLTLDEAGTLLKRAEDMKSWLSDLEGYVFGGLMSGQSVDGWKLVEGRRVRRFSDTDKVRDVLLDAGYDPALIYKPRELITLTQMEKDFGKKNVATLLGDLIITPDGKPTLAADTDRRKAIQPADLLLNQFDT